MYINRPRPHWPTRRSSSCSIFSSSMRLDLPLGSNSYQKIRNICRQISETLAEGSLPPAMHSPTATLTCTNLFIGTNCLHSKTFTTDWRDLPNKNVKPASALNSASTGSPWETPKWPSCLIWSDSGHRGNPQFKVPAPNSNEITPESTCGILARPIPDRVPFENKTCNLSGCHKAK